jgi:hypothetical protein
MATVKLAYESSYNISFKGVVDTGIDRDEWAGMSEAEQDEVVTQKLHELVDIDVKED